MEIDLDIKAEREALGISQADLAKAIGVDQSSVSLWERKKRVPRGPALRVLTQVLEDFRKSGAAA